MDLFLNGLRNAIWILSMNNKVKISFRNKPYPLAIEMRPLWRISLIVIISNIMNLKKKPLDIKKLNILLWMTIKHQNRSLFEKFLIDNNAPIPFISSDQANYVAIELAFSKNLLMFDKKNENLLITEKSIQLFQLIEANDLFENEIEFMSNFGFHITKKLVDKIIGKI